MSTTAVEALYPLSPSQQGMLFESLALPTSGRQIEQFLWRWEGELNRSAYEHAWQQVLARHPILRTGFLWKDQPEPLQFVLKKCSLPIRWLDISPRSSSEQEQEIERYLADDRALGFNLSRVPLLRIAIFCTAERRYQAVWTTHHILLDGWGLPIILKEVHALYQAECEGRTLLLPPARPYADYIAWLKRQDVASAEAFWRSRLRGFRVPTPLVGGAPAQSSRGPAAAFGEHACFVDVDVYERLRGLALQNQVTLGTVMQGLWALLLSRYSAATDVLFGATVSGRPTTLPQAESIVGLFINTVPRRIAVDPEATLPTYLQSLGADLLEQRAYEYCSAGQIQNWSEVPPSVRLYDSLLVFENYPIGEEAPGTQTFSVSEVRSIGAQTQYPLTVTVFPQQGLHIKFVYSRAKFAAADMVQIGKHLQALLRTTAANPLASLAALLTTIPSAEIPSLSTAPAHPMATSGGSFVPPLSPIEQALCRTWQSLFGLPVVSTDANFYDLGGHSLLAIRLVGQVQQQFGIQLPISALLLNPTIESLAKVIRECLRGRSSEDLFSSLVPIQPNGNRPPFFLAPGAGGTVFYMYYLTRYMDPNQPLYGLQALGLDRGTRAHATVEEMATHFLSEIKRVQPCGPYFLGGHSFGAFIAYELAQRLIKAGEEVACLIILDTSAPHQVNRLTHTTTEQWIEEYVVTFQEVLADKIVAPYVPPTATDPEAQWAQFALWLRENKLMSSSDEVETARNMLEVFKLQLTMNYVPKDIVPMRATIFRATGWDVDERPAQMGWDDLQVDPEILPVPGNHMTFVGEPHIQVVASKLSDCLQRAQRATGF